MNQGPTRAQDRAKRRRMRLTRTILVAIGIVFVVAGVVVWAISSAQPTPDAPAPAAEIAADAPQEPVKSAAQQLIASSDEPNACAVTFSGQGAPEAPQLQITGTLYSSLPIPEQEGAVFAGWYASDQDAAARTVAARINGAEVVSCVNQEVTLHAAWVTPEANAAEDAQIPILMYHQFTTNPDGEEGWLRGNYAYIGDFEAQMNYLATGGFYLPTWDELNAFVDGKLFLPDRSVIITDDDADITWYELAVPIIDSLGLITTSFMITADNQQPSPSTYVLTRSHTHGMHQGGENGRGLMTNLTAEEIAADLNASAGVVGAKEVVAYPYGHHEGETEAGTALAGYWFGRTIEPGFVSIGTNRYALPVIRMNYGDTLADLQNVIG